MQRESQEETSSTTGKERIPELDKVVVVKRSYSRATFRSFPFTQSRSLSDRKLFSEAKSLNTASMLKGSKCPQIKSRLRHQSQDSTVYELNFGTYTYIKTTLSWRTLGMRKRRRENCTQTLAENSEDFPLNGESPETRKTRWRG